MIIRARPPVTSGAGWPDDGTPLLLRRIYGARGIENPDQLGRLLAELPSPAQLQGLDAALDILEDTLQKNHKVLIVGDFDADGATSTALGVLALESMGLGNVDFLVPNRFEYGYGLTPEIVELALTKSPNLLITVDNGISSLEGVATAKAAGLRVIVTDHHLPGSQLPAADAIVNPNQPGCPFPTKNLAGVGVVFFLLTALRSRLRARGWFAERGIAEPNMATWLDLVALGTVADVVPLDRVNRILVHQGLMRMRAGFCRPGILALLEVAGRDRDRLVASDLGFSLGPRLNAAGRLDDMTHGIHLLLEDNPALAREMAVELDQLNSDRRVIAFGEDGNGALKGSARSIPGLHIRDALDAVATRHPGLVTRFGGHAMAAGLSLSKTRFDAFASAFDEEVRRCLTSADLEEEILIDGVLDPKDICLDNARSLRDAGPWGQQFPEPLFRGEFTVLEQRVVGGKHLKMTLGSDHARDFAVDAIAFNVPAGRLGTTLARVDVLYRLDVNHWRGRESVQLVISRLLD